MNPLKTFFTADQHFGAKHQATVHREGFDSAEHMDQALIDAWNAVVPQDGHTYCLGDFSMSKAKRTSEILEQLNGRKYLIIGNHDKKLNLANKEHFEWVKPYHEQRMDIGPDRFTLIMCHYAFRSWNNMHYGSWNLHGHSHGHLPRIKAQLDVGVDSAKFWLNAWCPFSMQDIWSILCNETAESEDHHQPPTG